jgi:hypothetical protein
LVRPKEERVFPLTILAANRRNRKRHGTGRPCVPPA